MNNPYETLYTTNSGYTFKLAHIVTIEKDCVYILGCKRIPIQKMENFKNEFFKWCESKGDIEYEKNSRVD